MPVTVKEQVRSRRVSGREAERVYIIKGTLDENEARDAMFGDALCPTTLDVNFGTLAVTFPRQDPDCYVEEAEDGIWLGRAYWRPLTSGDLQPIGYFQLSFDISGQAQKCLFSRSTVSHYESSGEPVRDFKQAINVNEDLSIEGTDIIVPWLSYECKRIFRAGDVNNAYIRTLSKIVGTVNDGTYKDYFAGEMLLSRVSGVQRSDNNWDLTFNFAISTNETGLSVGDITGINKDGWDFLWVYYMNTAVDIGGVKTMVKKPRNAYVERVYRRSNYDLLLL